MKEIESNIIQGLVKRKKTKTELMNYLVESAYVPHGNMDTILQMAEWNNIVLTLEEPEFKEGWVGKAKGI